MSSTVQLAVEHGYATVRLTGDLDLEARPLLDSVTSWSPPVCDHPGLVVDLTQVTFIDVACTRDLASLLHHVSPGPCVVLAPPGIVTSSLEASGFSRRFVVVPVGRPRDGHLHEAELRMLMRPWPAPAVS